MGRGLIARWLRGRPVEAGEPVPDAELLARFAGAGDEAAFELLVWRHAAMVLSVCRRIVRDDHLAEDAFQAVFLVLARKAGSVRGANLAGWLFRVARRVSSRARRQAERRARWEAPLTADVAGPPLPCPAEGREELAVLDEEVARLPERFRLPVLLCYLGGRTTEDAARVLGCPRGTVLSRLATARQRLAARLTRRGVTLPAGVLGTVAVPSVSGVVPPTVHASLSFLAAGSRHTTSNSIFLANGALTTMRLQPILAAAVVILPAGLFGGYALLAGPADGPVTARAPDPPQGEPVPPRSETTAAKADRPTAPAGEDAARKRLQDADQDLARRIAQLDDEIAQDYIAAAQRAIQFEAERKVHEVTDPLYQDIYRRRLADAIPKNEAARLVKSLPIDNSEPGRDDRARARQDADAVLSSTVMEIETAHQGLKQLAEQQARLEAGRRALTDPNRPQARAVKAREQERDALLAVQRAVRAELLRSQYGLPEHLSPSGGGHDVKPADIARGLEELRREVRELKRK
ncbi:MAG: sigma-70 family RNA polymerase sigma factor [Gemmataceae bacterium]|nr:sigma-70 family RNA polymerase sigma factor [Gemmataceae bacterium]